mgnify:FL=1
MSEGQAARIDHRPPRMAWARWTGATPGMASDAAAHASSAPLLLFLCLLWYSSSALSSNTSKSLMSKQRVPGQEIKLPPKFPYPITLTLIQFVFINVYCYAGTRRSLLGSWTLTKRLAKPTLSQLREVAQISVFNVVGHALSSLAIMRVPVSLVHTIKALSPLITVLSYVIFFRVSYSMNTYVALVPLMFGVVLACSSLTASTDDVVGFSAALGSTFIFVAQNIYTKNLLKPAASAATNAPQKLDKIAILFYSSACSVVLMLPMTLFYDTPRMMEPNAPPVTLYVLYLLSVNGLVHFAQNLLAFQVLAHVSPVTYSVANLFKRVFVILVAIVRTLCAVLIQAWFGQHVTPLQWLGIGLTFLGLCVHPQFPSDAATCTTMRKTCSHPRCGAKPSTSRSLCISVPRRACLCSRWADPIPNRHHVLFRGRLTQSYVSLRRCSPFPHSKPVVRRLAEGTT